MKRYQNIALCQINVVAGKQEYYLPKNTNWLGKKISKIVVYTPQDNLFGQIVSPVDGVQVFTDSYIGAMYFDLYNSQGESIWHNVSAYQATAYSNYSLEVQSELNYELSRIYFTTAPATSGAVMLYLFYGETDALADEEQENVTVQFTVPARQSVTLQNVIERYMYARAKGVRSIVIWNNRYPQHWHGGFVTLRDKAGVFCHENIPTFMLRPQQEPADGAIPFLAHKMPLDVVELDFNNSEIFNSLRTDQEYTVTFYY